MTDSENSEILETLSDLNVLEEAILFATRAHAGQMRKFSGIPYILHPMEVAAILATMTDDKEVMAAGVLHDTVEDCHVDPAELRAKFGARVANLVGCETEDNTSDRPPEETWRARKEETLLILSHTKDVGVKMMWLADKLSNIRSFYREYLKSGDELWQHLHQKDPAVQEWYYRTIAENLTELADTPAYREYVDLCDRLFRKEIQNGQ